MMSAEELRRLLETVTSLLDDMSYFEGPDEADLESQLAAAAEWVATLAEKGY